MEARTYQSLQHDQEYDSSITNLSMVWSELPNNGCMRVAVLEQLSPEEDWKPVHFTSASFTETQCRYSMIEKEACAVVMACERFAALMMGHHNNTVLGKERRDIKKVLEAKCPKCLSCYFRMKMKSHGRHWRSRSRLACNLWTCGIHSEFYRLVWFVEWSILYTWQKEEQQMTRAIYQDRCTRFWKWRKVGFRSWSIF